MRILYKISRIVLFFVCFTFYSQFLFAQDIQTIKSDIYSKLKCCPCKETFEKCTCQEAKEIKAYIDALLETGVSKDEIFFKVAKKFSLNVILDEKIKSQVKQRLSKEAGQIRPELVLDATSFDFGQMSKKQGKVSKNFKLSNKGKAPLVIKNIKTSCPCAFVSLRVGKSKSPYFGTNGTPEGWQAEIKPGKSGELEFMIDLASPHVQVGKVIREATIISNDPIYPEVTVRIEAEVKD